MERGDYATSSEVVRAALRDWELNEVVRRLEGERVARLWDEGLASGPAVAGAPVMTRLRAKYAEMEKAERNGKPQPATKGSRRRTPKVA